MQTMEFTRAQLVALGKAAERYFALDEQELIVRETNLQDYSVVALEGVSPTGSAILVGSTGATVDLDSLERGRVQ